MAATGHRLVLSHGENFTTQDLIREADVSLQTLYRNFGGKDQSPTSSNARRRYPHRLIQRELKRGNADGTLPSPSPEDDAAAL